jgi:hypothetical protein
MRSHHSQVPAVGIYCYSLELGATPISDYYYWEAYQDLVLSLRATGVEVYFVTPASPYLGRGRFAYGYTLDQKLSDPAHMRRVNDIRVNIILERSEPQPFEGTDVPLLNSAEIRSMINDKISLWEHFGEFQAESRIVYDVRQLLATVRLMPGNKVVVKVPNGFGGTGVYIGKKSDVLRQVPRDQFPLLTSSASVSASRPTTPRSSTRAPSKSLTPPPAPAPTSPAPFRSPPRRTPPPCCAPRTSTRMPASSSRCALTSASSTSPSPPPRPSTPS